MVAQQAGTVTSSGSGVLLSGTVPPLADAYYPREQSGPDLASSIRPGQTVVLVHGEESGQDSRVPAAQGGTGKTQLAVEFTHAMWNTRTVEILIWVNAASRESVITGFAQAANTVDASQPAEGAETAAARFVSWLAHTRRPWALVIDDLAELSDLEDLWPSGASGRVLITTRLPADGVRGGREPFRAGGDAEGMNLRVVPVPGLNRREALDYVTSRLSDYPDQRIEALDLGEDLDGLPLALAQATAAMSARRQGCREYRALLAERIGHMPAVPGVSAAVLATWSIAAECAHELPPAGLAWPTLVLAAMLDHHGVPGAVLTSPAACGYIAGRPSTANAADQNMVRAAINNLAQAGLVTIDPVSPVRTVQMHASVQAAVRAYLPAADLEQVVLAAADALLETWPDGDGDGAGTGRAGGAGPFQQAQLEQALRDCAATLRTSDGGLLWKPEAHPLLFRAGLSLEHSRLSEAAITYWKSMVATSTRLLGPAHANAVVARDRLAAAYEAAGKSADAIAVFQTALAEREQHQGAEHPETIAARAHLAHAYQSAGRPADAIGLYERTVADSARLLGAAHPVTLDARASLAETYQASGEPAGGDRGLRGAARRRRAPPRRRPPHHAGRPGQPRRRLRGQRAGQGRDRAVSAGPVRPGADARTRPPGHHRGPGQPGLGLPLGREAEGRHRAVRAGAGRPRADLGRGPPGHHRGPGQPGLRLPQRGTAARGRAALRAHPRRPDAGPGRRSPRHPHRAFQPGRLLPAGPPADRRHPAVREGAGRQRADARARRHGDADHPLQPGHRLLHGRTAHRRGRGLAAGPHRLRALPRTGPPDDPDRAREPRRRHPGLRGPSEHPGLKA